MKIFTVGYEGFDIDEFADGLKKKGIRLIADLRKNPVSRKRGFSKNLLRQNLETRGIEYIHMPGLGTPTEWRKQAKAQLITRDKMFRDFTKKIIPAHPTELQELRELAKKKKVALLCYETEAADCHRRCVSDELVRLEKGKLEVIDLELPKKEPGLFRGS
jgi:uncharacterized protein (DUF488 family)